mgnify:FL=1
MKKLIFILMVCSLFAEKVESVEEIKITQESNVLIYTNLFWAPCKEAKALLQSRGIDYSTKLVTFSKKSVNEMAKKTGGRTSVPQIFVDEKYFGGLLELKDYYKEK